MQRRHHHQIIVILISIGVSLFIAKPILAQGPVDTPTSTPTPGEVVNPSDIAALPAGMNVLLNFDNFASPYDSKPIPAGYAGCIWNSLVEGSSWAGITTWNFYITNGGLQGAITFPRPVIINSIRVSSGIRNVFTLVSNGNPDVSLTTSGNIPQTLVTGWINPVTSLTLRSSTTDQVFDDLRLTMSGGAQTPAATSIASNTPTPTITHTPTRTSTSTPTPTTTSGPTLTSSYTPTNTPTPIHTPVATITPSPTVPPSGGIGITVDHTNISQFSEIPQVNIQNASALRTLFMHQSVGNNIDFLGLQCLAGLHGDPSYYPPECITYAENPYNPYDNRNWNWRLWDSSTNTGNAKVDLWVSIVNAQQSSYQVLGMKFCYVDSWGLDFDYYRQNMDQLEQAYPSKTFIWSTQVIGAKSVYDSDPTSLQACFQIQDFNQQLRVYARANNKILYDLADIESHDPNGNPCQSNGCEALCDVYYTGNGGGGGGHPDVGGSIRLAKGFWLLMARISGWDGISNGTPTPTPDNTLTPAPTETATPSHTPTPTPTNTRTSTPTTTVTSTNTSTPTSTPNSDLIFTDGFESGNLSYWSSNTNDGGDLSVRTSAALVGGFGLQAIINDNNAIYVTDNTPTAEPRYRARFYFDPNSTIMANGNAFYIFTGYSGASTIVVRIELRFYNNNYQLRAELMNDKTTWKTSNWFTISDVLHFIELDWRAATAARANNGYLTFWIDGTQQANLTNIDNDTLRIDQVQLGAISGIDTGTRGTTYFDAFESRQLTYIGR